GNLPGPNAKVPRMKPPNAEQLVGPPPHSLDDEWALKNFLGKTREQAQEMCRTNPSVTEDFMYMAPAGLTYYLPAALEYLKSPEADGEWLFAHGILGSLAFQVTGPRLPDEVFGLIEEIAAYCDAHRDRFEFDEGDLHD